jgi:TonB family protein
MALRLHEHEAGYRNHVSVGFLGSLLVHLGLLVAGPGLVGALRLAPDRPIRLGYRGPERILEELEVLEPNSVQSYFYQRQREGRQASPEYRVVEPIQIDPGDSEPIPIPEEKKEPRLDPSVLSESLELIVPLKPAHKEISFSTEWVILESVKPHYPEYELQRGIEGRVEVAIYVSPEGEIQDQQIVKTTMQPLGASPHAFELAVLEAVKHWRVLPPKRDGEPRSVWLTIPYNFDLPDDERE